MFILDEISKDNIVKKAHNEASEDLINSLKYEGMSEEKIAEACAAYRDCFLQGLFKRFNRIKKKGVDARVLPIKRLLDRLAEKGVTEYRVTTPPLCLTVKYNGMTLSFTYGYEGAIATVNGFDVRVPNWDEDIIELLEAIHTELQESNIYSHVRSTMTEYMANEVQKSIMISTALGIIREIFKDIDYEIYTKYVAEDIISIRLTTKWQTFLIEGTLAEFADKVEEKYLEVIEVIRCNM